MVKFTYRFFEGFRPVSFLAKTFVFYSALLAGVSTWADWSSAIGDMRDRAKAQPMMVLWGYLAMVAAWSLFEFVKLKFRYDLKLLQFEARARPGRRGR